MIDQKDYTHYNNYVRTVKVNRFVHLETLYISAKLLGEHPNEHFIAPVSLEMKEVTYKAAAMQINHLTRRRAAATDPDDSV